MITLIKWRVALGKGTTIDASWAGRLARISHIEALLLMLMVIAATGMARGVSFG
jgi:putative membrane protein